MTDGSLDAALRDLLTSRPVIGVPKRCYGEHAAPEGRQRFWHRSAQMTQAA